MSVQTRQTRPFNNNNNSTRFPNSNYSQRETYCNDENLESLDHLFKEVNLNDNSSVLAQMDEEETNSNSCHTVHSNDENEQNNITFKEGSINTSKNQILISVHDKKTEIKILKLFGNDKQTKTFSQI